MSATARFQAPPQGGLLADTGTDMVWLFLHDSIPEMPPDPLRNLVAPVYDPAGHLIDWRVRLPVPADLTAPHAHREAMAAFETVCHWRSEWLIERAITDASTLRLLLAWGDARLDISLLHRLSLPHAHIDVDAIPSARWQVKQLRQQLARGGDGLALLNANGALIRCFPSLDQPVTVLSNAQARIDVRTTELTLAVRPAAFGDQLPPRLTILGWRNGDDEVMVSTDAGEFRIADPPTVALLMQLAAGNRSVRVTLRPLGTLFAPTLAGLADITRLADTGHARLYVRRGLT